MGKKYSVVEFLKYKSVALISNCWVYEEKSILKCYWPKLKGKQLSAAIKNCTPPLKDTWKSYEIRLYRSLGLTWAKKAEETSNLESEYEPEAIQPQKRIRSSYQREDFLYNFGPSENNFTSSDRQDADLIPNPNNSLYPPDTEFLVPATNLYQPQETDFVISNLPELSIPSAAFEVTALSSPVTINEANAAEPYQDLKSKIASLQALVAEHLVTIKEGVRDLTHHNVIPGTRINTDFEELLDLIPISGKSELEEFDLWLNQDGKLKILKRYLGSLGGNTVGQVTRGILMKLFSLSFAIYINYSGTNRKLAFQNLPVHRIVIASTRINLPISELSEKTINLEIQKWFRGASDRHGGRKRPRSGNVGTN